MKASKEQAAAFETIMKWLTQPNDPFMVLTGSPGTGKSYLINYIHKVAPKIAKILNVHRLPIYITGVTNKSLSLLPKDAAPRTIHGFMNLRVKTDYSVKPHITTIQQMSIPAVADGSLIIIDECSMLDSEVLKLITSQLNRVKVLFVGDRYQLPPVKSKHSPVFASGFPTVELTVNQRVEDSNSALADTIHKLKIGVECSKILDSFQEDKSLVILKDEETFIQEFKGTEGNKHILAYKNNTVNSYGAMLEYGTAVDDYVPAVGDLVYNVSFVRTQELRIITTQAALTIMSLYTQTLNLRPGEDVEIPVAVTDSGESVCFLTRNARKNLIKRIQKDSIIPKLKKEYLYRAIGETIAEFRPLHVLTVHQSQGSTVDTIFLDYDDIVSCTNKTTAAQLLYVAVSRARKRAVLLRRA